MGEREDYRYDAFISYRHSELDSFVAENIHHELERFKLPGNLAKTRVNGEKNRIERVFRDRDELPISADLSDNITRALGASEYLIVICTPRLKESIWCKSEIETFISLKGRDHVLAVLAEGEPAESFPEMITRDRRMVVNENGEEEEQWVQVEPLAADVRGASKAEIRKKIKEEIIRLAAAMFKLNYDEIKQRHREEKLRRRVHIASGVAGVCLIFGGFVTAQAFRINQQKEQIDEQYQEIESQYQQIDSQYKQIDSQYKQIDEQYAQIQEQYVQIQDQYDEIEAQYSENLIKQSQVVMKQVDVNLREGLVNESKELILSSIENAGEKLPDEAAKNYKYKLAEVLCCYDDGGYMRPKANLEMNASVAIISSSGGYKYLAASDVNGVVAVWNVETLEKVAEIKTDFINATETYSYYGFDVHDNFICVGDNSVNYINTSDPDKSWTTEVPAAKGFCGIDEKHILAVSNKTLSIIERATGEIKKTVEYPDEDIPEFLRVDYIRRSIDDKYIFIFGVGQSMVNLLKVSCDDLSIVSNIKFDSDSATSACVLSDGRIVVETMDFGETLSENFYKLYCYDADTMEELWKSEPEKHFAELHEYKDKLYAMYSGGICELDKETFEVNEISQLNREISDTLVMVDGRLKLLLKDGSMKIQNVDAFSFYEIGDYKINQSNISSYKYFGGKYAVSSYRSKYISIYGISATEYGNEVSEGTTSEMTGFGKEFGFAEGSKTAKLEDDKIVIYEGDNVVKSIELGTSFVEGIYVDEKSDTYFVMYGDKKIDIISLDENNNKKVLNSVNTTYNAKVIDMSDKYVVILCDSTRGYVINREDFMIEACVYGYLGYDEASNTFTAQSASEKTYTIPFFTLDELIAKCK